MHLVALLLGAGACTSTSPAPTPIEADQPAVSRPRRRADQPEVSPRSPQVKTPTRGGEQLSNAEIERVLADADRALVEGRKAVASVHLRKCANKVPADVRCDTKLGVLLARDPKHRAEALYLLEEVATSEDTKLSASQLDAVAEELRRLAQYELSARAWRRAIAIDDTAQRHAELSRALVSAKGQFTRAIEELERAYEMDPSQHAWLLERATLMSQRAETIEPAIPLMQAYLDATKGASPSRDEQIQQRIDNLTVRLDALDKARENNGEPTSAVEASSPAQ